MTVPTTAFRRRAHIAAAVFVGVALSGTAGALVLGGTNFDLFGYPKPKCSKPYKPTRFTSQSELDSYKADADEYLDCARNYVDNANRDIDRIKEAASALIEEANSM